MEISIILPVFDPGERIIQTISSILSQSFTDYEIIIQDGTPTDAVERLVVDNYPDRHMITVFHEKDTGVYDAMNKGVMHAAGEYVYFIGAGDTLYDDAALEDIANILKKERYDIVYGYVFETIGNERKKALRHLDWRYPVKFTPVCHQAVFARTELLRKYPFDLKYKIAADQDWLLRAKKMGSRIQFVDRAVAFFPLDGMSARNIDVFHKEQMEIHKKYYPFWKELRYTWRRITGKA